MINKQNNFVELIGQIISEINYKNVFKFIYEKGFEGILGMEHGNSIQGERGEKALVEAYLEADSF